MNVCSEWHGNMMLDHSCVISKCMQEMDVDCGKHVGSVICACEMHDTRDA